MRSSSARTSIELLTENMRVGRLADGVGAWLASVAVCLSVLAAAGYAQSHTIQQLFSFPCPSSQTAVSCPIGESPNVLIQASDGNFYGAAEFTTLNISDPQGGTLFKITPSGQFTRLFIFSPNAKGDYVHGDLPATALVEGNDGFIYGTTHAGSQGNGVLFRVSKNGTNFKVVHGFCSDANCADGSSPNSLVLGQDGSFYGVTQEGGLQNSACPNGCGTIFRFTPPTAFTTLFEFDGSTSVGESPFGLIQGEDGNFYGAGDNVFRFSVDGKFLVLATFPPIDQFFINKADSQLVQAVDGTLYGGLAAYDIKQTQFYEIDPAGSGFQVFPRIGRLGVHFVIGSVIQASDGNLWTALCCTQSHVSEGSVIAMSPTNGALLQDIGFDGANGSYPYGGTIQGADGKIYGTASEGGTVAQGKVASGTVWVLDAGLPAPMPVLSAFTPTNGGIGSEVTIRGNSFIGTTAVTFQGVSAAFKVLNVHFITAIVPVGAKTGRNYGD